jgi:hypothetical protein
MGIGADFGQSRDAIGKVPTIESHVCEEPSNPFTVYLQSQANRHISRSEPDYHSLISALKHSRAAE